MLLSSDESDKIGSAGAGDVAGVVCEAMRWFQNFVGVEFSNNRGEDGQLATVDGGSDDSIDGVCGSSTKLNCPQCGFLASVSCLN